LTIGEMPTYNFATLAYKKTPAIREGLWYRPKHCLFP
jgi:hypothetical protein